MKPLKFESLSAKYGSGFDEGTPLAGQTISNLSKTLEKDWREDYPVMIKEAFLSVVQLYFDALLGEREITPDQEGVLKDLYGAGKQIVGSFYRGEGLNTGAIDKLVLPNSDILVGSIPENIEPKRRHCFKYGKNVHKFGLNLPYFVIANGEPDSLVAVATGAFEPAFLAMDILEQDDLLALRYSRAARTDKFIRFAENGDNNYPGNHLRHKKVLTIEDVVATGSSVEGVMKFIDQFNPKQHIGCAVKAHDNESTIPKRVYTLGNI
jgi:hypothetical protein